ncbi:MAG: NAD(P)H-quinone oxidoreductase [Gammaproteobacteria bacterium]|nr:MAG: NAD(P)H-quinone oxidoreductase [Gammaproteobacteria bacterium]
MKAIQVEDGKLVWANAEAGTVDVGEVRIRIAATAVNRADLVQRTGGYPPPPGASPILGLECAGEVIEVGEGVSRVSVGDSVCALLAGGGYAEEVVVPAGQVLPIPGGVSMTDAAALPEVFATAYLNLFMEAGASLGERVLLHAGASGVGTAAIQLCKQRGNPCFVTAGNPDKIERCLALGAEGGWNRHDGDFVDPVKAWAPEGVDVILDPVGAGYLADNLTVLGPDGRLVIIGLMGGAEASVNLGLMMVKRQRIIGSTLRARSVAAKSAVMDALQAEIWPHIERGSIKPVIDAVIPIEEAERAHALVAADQTFGKVVMTVGA